MRTILGVRRQRSFRLEPEAEAEAEHPDREHRGEHTEDDARGDQIGTSESVYEQPQPPAKINLALSSPKRNRARRSRERRNAS